MKLQNKTLDNCRVTSPNVTNSTTYTKTTPQYGMCFV
jgi:hypothetical protein